MGGGRWIRTTRRVRVRAPGFFDGSPLARAVRLLRAALPAEEPGPWRLMDLLSFLAPCVPEAVLPDTAATAAPPALAGSGLAWRAGRGGRAMAEVWRKTLSLEGTEAAAEAALALAAGLIPESQERPRLVLQRLAPVLPHSLAALAAAENARVGLAAAFAVRVGVCPLALEETAGQLGRSLGAPIAGGDDLPSQSTRDPR